MDKHVNLIAILWIIYGAIGLFFGFVAAAILFGLSFVPLHWEIAAGLVRLIAWAIACFFLFLALPQIVGGIGLMKRQEWGRILILVVSFFHLLSFPLGTALGVYSFVILLKDETIKLFARPSRS
jgi:hypothetical protein